MKKKMFLVILFGLIACACLLVGLTTRQPRPTKALYKVTFIPSLGGFRSIPHSLNNRGQIVGVAETPARTSHIFLWDRENGFRNLDRYDVRPYVGRLCLNDAGQIAGTVTDPNGNHRAFLWEANGDERLLGTLGGHNSVTRDLNNRGQVVGYAEDAKRRRRAFIWDPSAGMREIGTLGGEQSSASSVNDAGQVVGWSETAGLKSHLFFWDAAEGLIDLGPAGTGPFRCYINNNGVAILRHGSPTGKTRFVMWTRAGGAKELDFVASNSAEPCALNNSDQFLVRAKPTEIELFGRLLHRRQECYLWDKTDGVRALFECVSVPDMIYLKPRDLNDKGCIAANVRTEGVNQLRPVFLEPIQEQ